jgi:malate dehydrogenase (oxaloacetate-decarboxylating)(NADP+)
VEEYFRMRRRRGVMRSEASRRVARPDTFAAMMVHRGDADMVIAGSSSHYVEALRTILTVIGPAPGVRRVSSAYLVLLPKDVVVLADCAVNVDPGAEDLAEIALLAAATSRALGIDPHVAMLSFSNFGSAEHPHAEKVRRAVEIAKAKAPDLVIDGEMQLPAARDAALRKAYFPFSTLTRDANVLIFPDLQSGSLTMYALHYMGEAIPIGPVLMGTSRPAHVLQYGATVEEIVNLTTVGVVQAAARRAPAAAGKPV